MILKMYSSILFVLITYVIVVFSQSTKKEPKEVTLDFFVKHSRSKNCLFPAASLYAPKGLLQSCNTTDGTKVPEVCSTFLRVSLQLCVAIIKDSVDNNNSKALASKFEVNITDEAVKLENRLCELSGPKAMGISDYASYMNDTVNCQRVCNKTKRICSLLVVALCKLYSSPICDPPPIKANKTIDTGTPTSIPVKSTTTSASMNESPTESTIASQATQSFATTIIADTEGNVVVSSETSDDGLPGDGDEEKDFTIPPDPASVVNDTEKKEGVSKTHNDNEKKEGNSNTDNDKEKNEDNSNTDNDTEKKEGNSNTDNDKEKKEGNSNTDNDTEKKEGNSNTDNDTEKKEGNSNTDNDTEKKEGNSNTDIDQETKEGNSNTDNDQETKEGNSNTKNDKEKKEGNSNTDNDKEKKEGNSNTDKDKEKKEGNSNTDNDKEKKEGNSNTDNDKENNRGNIKKNNSDKKQSQRKGEEKGDMESIESDEESHGSGHFIAYFLTAVVICVAGYIIFHNKQKIFAFVIEGRNAHSRRQRSKGPKYSELKSNVEEVMPSLEKTAMAKNFVY